MNKYKIFTDSSSELTLEMREKANVDLLDRLKTTRHKRRRSFVKEIK